VRYPSDKTWQGKVRQRQSGGGAKGVLPHMEDKLFFILVYQKTNPLQTMHGLQFELSQPQSHYWIHRLLPVLKRALAALGVARNAMRARSPRTPWPWRALLMASSTARNAVANVHQCRAAKGTYSGKKKAHTDKNLVLINAHTTKVIYLGPTVAGKTHDKKAADAAPIAYPTNATLGRTRVFRAMSQRVC